MHAHADHQRVTLPDVLITSELACRVWRSPDYAAENRALVALAKEMAATPGNVPRKLADLALELCRAGTVGVSLIKSDTNGEFFYWQAVAGRLAAQAGGRGPLESPCGIALKRHAPQLFRYPERYFSYLERVKTPIPELLVVPFYASGRPLGAIWIMAHDRQRRFDGEDQRILTSLAEFAAVALRPGVFDPAERQRSEEEKRNFIFLVENSNDFIGMCDMQRNVFFINRGGQQLIGLDSLEQARRTPVKDFFFPEDQVFIEQQFLPRVLRDGHGEVEIRFRHFKTGEALWMIYSVLALQNATGERVGLATISRDITAQKRAYEEQMRANTALKQEIHSRRRAEEALRASEARYRTLFESIDEGFCIIEMLFDDNDTPVDYRFLVTNPAFEKHTGLTGAVNKTARELAANVETHWPEIYGNVAMTGKPVRFENVADALHRWFDLYAFRLGAAEERKVAVLFKDITERKRKEQLLVEQKRLLELIATGRPLDECLTSLCSAVARLNPGARASILLADDQRTRFQRAIAPGFPPSFGQRLEGAPVNELFIGTCGKAVYTGEPVACADIADNDKWSQEWRDLCVTHGVLACCSTPITGANGLPLGSFMLCFDAPRMPNEWERRLADCGVHVAGIALARDWLTEALRERQEADAALRESDARYRTLFNSIDEGFCIIEMLFDDTGKSVDYRFLEVNPTFGKQTGLERAANKTARDLVPKLEAHWFEIYGSVALTGEPVRFEDVADAMNRWFDVYAFRVGLPEDRKVAILFKDITERKRTEETLRRQHERQWLLSEAAGLLLATADADALFPGLFAKIAQHLEVDAYCNFMINEARDAVQVESHTGLPVEALQALMLLKFRQDARDGMVLSGRPLVLTNIQQSEDPGEHLLRDLGFRACVCNPLMLDDRLLGVLWFASRSRNSFDEDELEFLRTITRYVTVAHERLQLIKQLRESDRHKDGALKELRVVNTELDRRVIERTRVAEQRATQLRTMAAELSLAEERERQNLAADLHDGLSQGLSLARLKLSGLRTAVRTKRARRQIEDVAQLLHQANASVRAHIFDLSPPVLEDFGLIKALEWLAEDLQKTRGLKVRVQPSGRIESIEERIRFTLFRAARELLINVAKHAGTDHATVAVENRDRHVALRVEDSGDGFDPARISHGYRGFGLLSIRERLSYLGGDMNIESAPGKGARITLLAPVALHNSK